MERIFETIDEPVLVKDKEDAYDMPPIIGEVEFKDVSFSYEDGVPILNNVASRLIRGYDSNSGTYRAGKTT